MSILLFFFADDARQQSPSRSGMSALVGIGGFSVSSDSLISLERDLDRIAHDAGLPRGEEFKWSPHRGSWMRENLVDADRQDFFFAVIDSLVEHKAVATVVASDTNCSRATWAKTHEDDVTQMYLERAHTQLKGADTTGVVIVDRPGGGRDDERKFLLRCVEFLEKGSDYVRFERFAVTALCGDSHFVRALQAADLVASASMACIAGEKKYAPPVFNRLRPILRRNAKGFAGGTGLKLHPDLRFLNLYHWLLSESVYVRRGCGLPLPDPKYLYHKDAGL